MLNMIRARDFIGSLKFNERERGNLSFRPIAEIKGLD